LLDMPSERVNTNSGVACVKRKRTHATPPPFPLNFFAMITDFRANNEYFFVKIALCHRSL
jgi:hypothetical protein